jgi:hypothetical protein
MARAAAMAAVLAAVLCGCAKDLRQENARLRSQVLDGMARRDELQRQNDEMAQRLQQSLQQIDTLQQLGPERLELIPRAAAIELGRYSAALNTDGQDGDDAVKVLVRPIDPQGHVVKAAGSLRVELYDLQAEASANLLGRCELDPKELSRLWFGGFGTDYYGVVCPFQRKCEHRDITVRVEFADLVTGQVYRQQRVVPARLGDQSPGQ